MNNSTTYYWRINEINAGGTTTGSVWSFTTITGAPGQASNPSPSNSSTGVSTTADLSWTAGSSATSHNVYFGTSSPGTFRGNQAATSYDCGTMSSSTTYYWRIDEVNGGGTTTGTVWSFTTAASGTIYFSENFNSGSSPYSFDDEYDGRCTTYPTWSGSDMWAVQHLSTGGWNGSGGARLIARQGYEQHSIGWYGHVSKSDWEQGDYFYLRFRIKFDSTMRWDGTGSQQNKMFIWGNGTYQGVNMRVMLHQEADHETSPCCEMDEEYSNSNYGLFSLKRNIHEYCTPYYPITYSTWYHVQCYVKSSSTASATDACLKIWVNNNSYNSPSGEINGGFNLAVEGDSETIWWGGFQFGGYWTDLNNNRDCSWVVDDFQIGSAFDSNWAQ
jgi:hypothetical protein